VPKIPNWMLIALALVAALAIGVSRIDVSPTPDRSPATVQLPDASESADGEAQTTREVIWSHGRDGSARNAEEHWRKHGAEFPEYHSAEEYEAGALAFVRSPPPGTLTKRDGGDTLFYNPDSNTFAVADPRGRPRTFFRPDSGRAYWDRQ